MKNDYRPSETLKIIAICLIAMGLLAGCSAPITEQVETTTAIEQTEVFVNGDKIDAEAAKALIDENADAIILDVRTQEEFDQGHLKGALLLPNTEIEAQASAVLPDKDALILVYCRSGNRSGQATQLLLELGYSKVLDFGGIIDWPYEVVQ